MANQHSLFPFLYEYTEAYGSELIAYRDVEFTKDFGPIKRGEIYDMVPVDFANETIECLLDDDEEFISVHKFKFSSFL